MVLGFNRWSPCLFRAVAVSRGSDCGEPATEMPRGRHPAARGGVVVKVERDPAADPPLGAGAAAESEEYSPPLSSSFSEEATDSEGDGAAGRGGGAGCEPPLKKGPWTQEEDKRLRDYVVAKGEGNWNRVQREAGLNRCGKSCRLRWANHLRPDLKKCPFSDEEVEQIILMHKNWGNKWAKMASRMPGRTDNEIKNYWNTRLKRHQRANLPIYPEHISRVPDQDMNCRTPEEPRGRKRSNEFSQENILNYNSPIFFDNFDYDNQNLTLPESTLKRRSSTGCMESDYNGTVSLSCVQIPDGNTASQIPDEKMVSQIPDENTAPSTDFTTCEMARHFGNAIGSNHQIIDGNLSASGTLQGSMKAGLPSFQCVHYLNNPWYNPLGNEMLQSEFIPQENTLQLDVMAHMSDGLGGPIKLERCLEETIPALDDPSAQSIVAVDNCELEGHPSGETETMEFGSSASFTSGINCASIDIFASERTDASGAIFSASGAIFSAPDASIGANFFNDMLPLSEDDSIPHISDSLFHNDFFGG